MAAVICSVTEKRRFTENPEKYAEEFSLEPLEAASLIEMGQDLAHLTLTFVTKRLEMARWNATKALEMLGTEGDALLAEFVDTYPMTEWQRVEARSFGEFLIERTADMRDDSLRSRIIAEMARFESHRINAFWDATVPEERQARGSQSEQVPLPRSGNSHHRIKLRPGASTARFEWDVRLPYYHRVVPIDLLQPDPCQLFFFHNGTPTGFREIRLTPQEAAVVDVMSGGVAMSAEVIRDALPDGADLDRPLNRLFRQEILQWA
jgi:hypothetical protein